MRGESSERLQRILEYIQEFIKEKGYPPTVREIGEGVGIKSTSLITYYLKRLEDQNRIIREDSTSRGIRLNTAELPPEPEKLLSIPYYGYIVASAPIPVEPLTGEETVDVNQALLGNRTSDLFALRVRGDSMIDALINEGDLVILHHQSRVENGEMAAVWLPETGETTLKKIYYEGNQVRLQPANPTMEPFYLPAERVQIQGKVVMVIRRLE